MYSHRVLQNISHFHLVLYSIRGGMKTNWFLSVFVAIEGRLTKTNVHPMCLKILLTSCSIPILESSFIVFI